MSYLVSHVLKFKEKFQDYKIKSYSSDETPKKRNRKIEKFNKKEFKNTKSYLSYFFI